MAVRAEHPVEVFKVHPATLWVAIFAALLVQTVLPLTIPRARLFDCPLLTVIYFALLKRSKVFGIGLGTCVGLLQDALSHHYIGLFGMAKALVGYLSASASVKFDIERIVGRFVLAGVLVFVHSVFLFGLEYSLLDNPPSFQARELASGILLNAVGALVLFQVLDRFKHPA